MALDAKTQSMLEKWEAKYGLDEIQKRLDDGLFSDDPRKVRDCKVWLKGRRLAPAIQRAWKLVFSAAAFAASIFGILSYFKT